MSWRKPHGALADTGRTSPVWEDDTRNVRPAPDGAAEPVLRRSDGTLTPKGAREMARRAHESRKAPDFGSRSTPWLPPLPELERFERARADLMAQRRSEICDATGGVDSGVGAQIRAWSYIHASVEYWWAKFLSTGSPDCYSRMVQAAKAASTEDAKLRDAAVWSAKSRQTASDDFASFISIEAPASASQDPSSTSSDPETEDASDGSVEPGACIQTSDTGSSSEASDEHDVDTEDDPSDGVDLGVPPPSISTQGAPYHRIGKFSRQPPQNRTGQGADEDD